MHPKYWKFPGAAFREQANDGTTGSAGGSGPLDTFSAASAFESRLDDEPEAAPATVDAAAGAAGETDEQAAERLAREDAGTVEPAAADVPQSITIKVDGKDVTLTPDEMAEHVKNGMRQADYSRKTAEAAEQRKTADAEITQAREQRNQYGAKLGSLLGQANYELNALRAQLTDELLDADPHGYMVIQRTAETRQAAINQAQQELQQITEQQKTEATEAQRHHLAHQQELLLAKLPEWKDPAKAKAEVAQLTEYLMTQGLTREEAEFTDHREVLLARKAMLYDGLMERARGAVQKVSSAPPKVERPGNADSARPGDARSATLLPLSRSSCNPPNLGGQDGRTNQHLRFDRRRRQP
jgi:hypothetical protein